MPFTPESARRINPAQEGALLHGVLATAGNNVEQLVFTLPGPVDIDVLARTWRALGGRHGVLQSGFRADGNGGHEIVRSDAALEVSQVDLGGLDDAGARSAKIRELRIQDRERGFDPASPPLVRVTLACLPDDGCEVIWSMCRGLLDWRSMSMLLRELLREYEARLAGADLAHVTAMCVPGIFTSETSAGPVDDAAFWRRYLGGRAATPRLELPCDQDASEDDAAVTDAPLPRAIGEAARRLAADAGVSLQNFMAAAWALLLANYTDSNDVVIGLARCCRASAPPGSEDAIGPFTNIVPLRVRFDDALDARGLLKQVQEQHRLLREHEGASPAAVRRALSLDADQPLFETVFEFDLRNPLKTLREMFPQRGPRNFRHYVSTAHGLHLQVFGEQSPLLRLHRDPSRFDRRAARQLLNHFMRLVAAMAKEPERPVRDLDYLEREEALPVTWPSGFERRQSAGTLVSRFMATAQRHADRIAVSCGERSISYAQLDEASNALAARLRRLGAKRNALIGLCVDRSIEQIIGVLGILKAGAAYLPLDPGYPEERLAFLLQDSGARLVVTGGVLPAGLHDESVARVPVVVPDEGAADFDVVNEGDDLAYVIYTSGSTGNPKGVQVTHRNVLRLFDACESWLQAGPQDAWTMFHSFAFDFSVWEIWGALLYGGRLEVVPREVAVAPDAFRALLKERGITVLSQTPSAFRQLQIEDARHDDALERLRCVVFGGEALDVGGLLPWFERHGDQSPALINMYGITETTVHVTWRRIREGDARAHAGGRKGSPVGWPLPDLYVRLLDSRLKPVPPGVPGEICVGGDGVTLGYLNRDELNARHFIIDPYSEESTRMYRSGDYARLLPNGELDFIGRRDNQVKIRGFRIDLGEITSALRRIEGIDEGVVIAREGQDGEKRLFAYYVSNAVTLTEPAVRASLAEKLPPHMLPAAIIRVPHIPMNNNNKLDLRSLPESAPPDQERQGEPPANAIEETLARFWMQVLERPQVWRDDDFFALGGDSISALRVVRLASDAGIEISPRDIFEHAGLAALASRARTSDGTMQGEGNAVIREDLAELTPIQHWFFSQEFDKPDHWNRSQLYRVASDCDAGLLEQACLAVVAHHPALRTRYFRERNGRWRAETVEPEEALEFSRVELDHLAVEERREAVRLITREIQDSLNLASGLLIRAAHFSGGLEDGDRLLLSIHQLAADASSWKIILEDIQEAYRALAAGRDVRLAPARPAAEWARQVARKAASPLVIAEQAYWQRQLDVPGLGIETRATEAAAASHRITFGIAETTALMGEAHRAYGTEFEDLLLAAMSQAAAGTWPEREALRIDLVESVASLAGRSVGWLECLRPFVMETRHAAHPAKSICAVKRARRDCSERGMGYGMLRYLHPDSSPAEAEAASAGICVNASLRDADAWHANNTLLQPVDEDTGPLRADGNRLPHALIISAHRRDGRLGIRFRYDPQAVSGDVVTRFAASLEKALRDLIAHCMNREAAVRVPEDFPLAGLTQAELDAFPVPLEKVDDILPLSPIQRLHHALAGSDRDVGFDQWVFRLRGRIDEALFEKAWQLLLARHDSLRTVFVDRNLAEPRQAVLKEVPFELQRADWRLLSRQHQETRLAELLEADRADGFSMNSAPLTRVTLVRTGRERWILVWSHHQAQVDGWSWPILAEELGRIYDALLEGRQPQLPQPGSYRSYIRWLAERDEQAHANFWQQHLGLGTRSRSLISHTRRKGDGRRGRPQPEVRSLQLAADISRNIVRAAREFRVTPSVFFQAAFAIIIAGMTRRFDVTLGAAFSARTSGLPISDNTVGPFINDLPVHMRLDPTARIEEWLGALRSLQADLNHFQNVSPAELYRWTGNAGTRRLFDTLLVFQNYASGEAATRWGRNIEVEAFEAGVRTNYPLTISVTPGSCYRVDFHFDRTLLPEETVERLTRHLVAVLNVLTRNTDVRLDTVLRHVGERSAAAETAPVAAGRWNRRATDGHAVEEVAGDFVPHSSDSLEGRIAAVCREVLDLPDIRRDENFFDLGAQSVSMVEIHSRLQQALDRKFGIVTLFQHPSVAALARHFAEPAEVTDLADAARRGAARRAMLQRRREQHQSQEFEG